VGLKKDNFEQWISIGQVKLLTKLELILVGIEACGSKLSFYCNIAILGIKIPSVTRKIRWLFSSSHFFLVCFDHFLSK